MPPLPLDEGRVAAYVRGDVTASERAAVEAALDRDPEWLAVVAVLAGRAGTARPPPDDVSREGG